jgi:hypothetical protein
MLAWLGMQVIVFETPEGEGWLLRHEDQALAWVAGALPRHVEGPFDPSEVTLDLAGDDLSLRLVGGEAWTGRLTWGEPVP